MTPEARLDRLERITKLIIRAGLRARHELRDHDSKINYLIDLQIHNEEHQKQNEERFAKLAESQTNLARSQANTDQRLGALIDIIRDGHNGNAGRKN